MSGEDARKDAFRASHYKDFIETAETAHETSLALTAVLQKIC